MVKEKNQKTEPDASASWKGSRSLSGVIHIPWAGGMALKPVTPPADNISEIRGIWHDMANADMAGDSGYFTDCGRCVLSVPDADPSGNLEDRDRYTDCRMLFFSRQYLRSCAFIRG